MGLFAFSQWVGGHGEPFYLTQVSSAQDGCLRADTTSVICLLLLVIVETSQAALDLYSGR